MRCVVVVLVGVAAAAAAAAAAATAAAAAVVVVFVVVVVVGVVDRCWPNNTQSKEKLQLWRCWVASCGATQQVHTRGRL